MIVPVYILVPILSFLLALVFDGKAFAGDVKFCFAWIKARLHKHTPTADKVSDESFSGGERGIADFEENEISVGKK